MHRSFDTKNVVCIIGGLAIAFGVSAVLPMTTADPTFAAQSYGGEPMAVRHGRYLTPLGIFLIAAPIKWIVLLAPLTMGIPLALVAHNLGRRARALSCLLVAMSLGASIAVMRLWLFQ